MDHLSGWLAYVAQFSVLALIHGLSGLGLNLQWGKTGLFNVGIAAFIALGAYSTALVTTAWLPSTLQGAGVGIVLGLIVAMLFTGALSAAVGALTLRLRTDYLAIATFGIAVVVELSLRNATSVTGGPLGIGFIPRPFPMLADRPAWFACANLGVVAGIVVLVYVLLERLSESPWGRVLRAIREDERAALSLGKRASTYRLQAFAVGGALMGLGGALEAHSIGFISPDHYTATLTFQIWAMLVIGGSGNHRGVLLGAVFVSAIWSGTGLAAAAWFTPEAQAQAAAARIVLIGLLLALTLLWRPAGLLPERSRRRLTRETQRPPS
jgi:branched-chain amino acid transport system permease protein